MANLSKKDGDSGICTEEKCFERVRFVHPERGGIGLYSLMVYCFYR
jgi:hypothetical protein